jgi:drug/metabolite transporter (DMT)-like permease
MLPSARLDRPHGVGAPTRHLRNFHVATLLLALWPASCFAYIDPNTGGIIYQILFPVLVAIAAAWTFLKDRISALWSKIFRRERTDKDASEE